MLQVSLKVRREEGREGRGEGRERTFQACVKVRGGGGWGGRVEREGEKAERECSRPASR